MLFVGSYHVEDGRQNRVLISYTVLYHGKMITQTVHTGGGAQSRLPNRP